MSYVVLARKWRPKDFDEVIGQEHITTTLKNAISNNRVAHAYIFTGMRGVGKTSVARIFAKGLNCEKGPTHSPCNKCASCNDITSGTSMDVIEIDGASNNSVDQVRELRENIKFMPSYGRYKLYIIDEVHMLSIGAFNALLKTLEEPPGHAKFIFATTNPEKVPPTILSRCQRFDFRRIPLKLIVSKLEKITNAEKLNVSEDAVFSIAKASDGSLRDAESVLDQLASFCEKKINQEDVISLLGIIEEDRLADIIEKLSKKDAAGLLKAIDELIIAGKDISQFLIGLMGYLRNLMVLKVSSGLSSLIDLPDGHIARLKEQMKAFKIEELLYMFYSISATANAVKRSDVSRFIVEASLVKLSLRETMMPLPEIIEKITYLEANMKNFSSETRDEKRGRRDDVRNEKTVDLKIELSNPEVGADTPPKPNIPEEKSFEIGTKPRSAMENPIGIAYEEAESVRRGFGDKTADGAPGRVMLTKELVEKTWPALLQTIKNKKISVASYLLEGEIMEVHPVRDIKDTAEKCKISNGVQGSVITLGFTKMFNFHKEALERISNKKFAEETACEVFGQKVELEFVILEESKMPTNINDDFTKDNLAEKDLKREVKKDTFDEPIIQSAIEMFNGKIIKDKKGLSINE